MVILCPAARRLSVRALPRNPVPPVIKTFIFNSFACFVIYTEVLPLNFLRIATHQELQILFF
jgi:hypothetical protein